MRPIKSSVLLSKSISMLELGHSHSPVSFMQNFPSFFLDTNTHPCQLSSHSIKKLLNQIPTGPPHHSNYFSDSSTFVNSYKECISPSTSGVLIFCTLFDCKLSEFRLCVQQLFIYLHPEHDKVLFEYNEYLI
jgi:hypothetical protein